MNCTKSSFTKCCNAASPRHRFKIDEKVYLLDATTINLCLESFPWATSRQKKGARLKDNALLEYFKKRPGRKAKGVVLDQEIKLTGMKDKPRLVQFIADDGNEYRFVTNAGHLQAATVSDLYKERWKIELFFKWIKQNLKIKAFLGTSENAVLTRLWIALCVYLVLAYLAFLSKIRMSMQQILRLLQLNLLERRNLESLFKPSKIEASPQMTLL